MIWRTCFALLPGLLNSLPAFRSDPIDGLQFRHPVLDDAQDFGSERPTSFLPETGPMPLTKPAEVTLNAFNRRRRTVFINLALNWSPCSLSRTPTALGLSHSPAVTEGSDPMTVTRPGVL